MKRIISMLLSMVMLIGISGFMPAFDKTAQASGFGLNIVGFKAVMQNEIDVTNESLYLNQGEFINISLRLENNLPDSNQSYAVLFTLTNGDGRLLWNKAIEGNISIGAIDEIAVKAVAPENVYGGVLKYYVWNSLEEMKSVYPASETNANETVEGLMSVVDENNNVTINGQLSSGIEGRKVTALIFNPGKNPSDLPNDPSALNMLCETKTGQNGEFSFRFSVNVSQTGIYTAHILSEECAALGTVALNLSSPEEILEAIARINTAYDDTVMKQNLEDCADILSYRFLPFESIDTSLLAVKLVNKVEAGPFRNALEIRSWVMQQSIVEAYNQSKNDIVYDQNGGFNYPELVGFEQFDSQLGLTVYTTYMNMLDDAGRTFVRSRLLNRNYENMSDLQAGWIEETVLAAVKYANRYMDVHQVLMENGEAAGLLLAMYLSLPADKIALVDKMLMTSDYITISSLQDAIYKCVKDVNQSSSNHGGGSSGGIADCTTLLLQDFESTDSIPDGWVSDELEPICGTEASWSVASEPGYPPDSLAKCIMFNSYDAGNGNSARLHTTIGNGINIDGYINAIVNFDMYHDSDFINSNDTVQVQYSADGGVTWYNTGSSISRIHDSDDAEWVQHSVILTGVSGSDILIGLLGTSAYGNNIFIDDISVAAEPILPTAVLPSGLGTQADPYIIATAGNLVWITNNNASDFGFAGKYFKQTANITLRGEWIPIGDENYQFKGKYNGGGHYISGINITSGNQTNAQGLFGDIGSGGTVEKLSVLVNINSSGSYVGALAGKNSGIITNCYSYGVVNGNGGKVGGLVGKNSGIISNCYATDNVSVSCFADGLGGLAGYNHSTIINCFATGYVLGSGRGIYGFDDDYYTYVGGLTGVNGGTITNCYAAGDTIGRDHGLSDDYSHPVGGLAGGNDGTITNCYYSQDISGTYSNDGTMKICLPQPFDFYRTLSTYTTTANWNSQYLWDFDNIWAISEGVYDGIPYLFNAEPASIPDFRFKGSSLGEDPSNVVYPTEGGQHRLWVTYQNNTKDMQSTAFVVAVKKNNKVISIYTEMIDFKEFEELTFSKDIAIPSTNDAAAVEVDFFLWDGLAAMNPKHDTVKNSINSIR